MLVVVLIWFLPSEISGLIEDYMIFKGTSTTRNAIAITILALLLIVVVAYGFFLLSVKYDMGSTTVIDR